jgi:hypothetical protein
MQARLSAPGYFEQKRPKVNGNGVHEEGERGLAVVVVGHRDFISHSVQPVMAGNYLFCGIHFVDRFSKAGFEPAQHQMVGVEDTLSLKAVQ